VTVVVTAKEVYVRLLTTDHNIDRKIIECKPDRGFLDYFDLDFDRGLLDFTDLIPIFLYAVKTVNIGGQ